MSALGTAIEKGLSGETSQSEQAEELEQAIDLMSEEEATSEEKKILKGIQQFGNTVVKQVMRSRLDVAGIEYTSTFAEVISLITEQHYSRFPVYKTNLDEVVGVLHTKDLVAHIDESPAFHWQQLIRTPYFVPEQKPVEDLLQEFQQKHIHFAVVVDEFGGTCGIITMEDILEEIIGDIKDEFDEEETINVRLDEHNYLFEGKTMIHDACRIMQISLDHFDKERGESESVAGLLLELAERLPRAGEMIRCKGFTFTVMEVNANRIEKIKITTPSTIA
jgi:gliding motility-associated protein GldE